MKRVKIKAKGRIFEGVALPSDDNKLVLKLDSGYNAGFYDYEILEEKEVEMHEFVPERFESRENLGTIKVISTGGTIASKVDYKTGAVTSQFSAEEIVADIPELLEIANIDAELLYNILSENMKPDYWVKLARRVHEAVRDGYDGVVVTHGTDTMHYSASALAFMLRTPVPVVFVGAQRSSDRPSSDAAMNMICSAHAALSDLGEVTIVMHGTTADEFCYIHRGVKARKNHTSRRDAFESVNYSPLGKVFPDGRIDWIAERFRRNERELELYDKFEEKVALIKYYPGLGPEILEFFHDRGYRGFVIEGTGLGHVSTDWVETVKRVAEDSVIVMTSQCLWGRVCDRVYDTGRYLLKAGVIEGEDMLPETALIKLMWLLGNFDVEDARMLVRENIVGEINPMLGYEDLTI
ncbi:Glu-tRNA(Gln) amidotransferase subunit GatD [Geoglobus acetivorans]